MKNSLLILLAVTSFATSTLAQFTFENDMTTVARSQRNGHIVVDRIAMNVPETYRDLLTQPVRPDFVKELEQTIRSERPLILFECGCRYQQYVSGRTQERGRIISFGLNETDALRSNQKNCVEEAYEIEAQSFTRKSGKILLEEDIWAKLGHVQSVSTYDCHRVEVPLNQDFLNRYRLSLAKDAATAGKTIESARPGNSPLFIFKNTPDWLRISLATLVGGFAWRARGGGYVTMGGTQQARVVFGFLPYVFISYMAADNYEQFVDGTVMSTLAALPLAAGWADLQDIGRGNKNDPKAAVKDVNQAKYEEMAGMTLRGILQTMFAAGYANARGYGAGALTAAGAAMGPCYAAQYELQNDNVYGRINSPALRKLQLDDATARGEMCYGAAYGFALAKTLRDGQTHAARLEGLDFKSNSAIMLHDYMKDLSQGMILRPALRKELEESKYNYDRSIGDTGNFHPNTHP